MWIYVCITIVTHPDYDSGAKTDNIALWKLSSPVSTDTYTRLCLPFQVIVTIMSRDVTRSKLGGLEDLWACGGSELQPPGDTHPGSGGGGVREHFNILKSQTLERRISLYWHFKQTLLNLKSTLIFNYLLSQWSIVFVLIIYLRLIGDPGDRKTQHEDISSHYGFRFVLTLHPHSNEIKRRKKPYLHIFFFSYFFNYISSVFCSDN